MFRLESAVERAQELECASRFARREMAPNENANSQQARRPWPEPQLLGALLNNREWKPMRQGQQNRRGRGRNNNNNNNGNGGNGGNGGGGNRSKGQNPLTRSFESNGPDMKIRGTPSHIAEKYIQLARDASSSGDPVLAENYLQHAEHYNRIILAYREQQISQGGGDPNVARPRPAQLHDQMDGDDSDDGGMADPGEQPTMRQDAPRHDTPRQDMRHSEQPQPREPRSFEGQPREGQPRFDDRQPREDRQPRFGQDGQPMRRPHRERYEQRGERRNDRNERNDRQGGEPRGYGQDRFQGDRFQPERQGGERPFNADRDRGDRDRGDRGVDRAAGFERPQPDRQPVERTPFEQPVAVEPPVRAPLPPSLGEQPSPPIVAPAPAAREAPRRRERFAQSTHEQPEFLRRPVRRPRREAAVEGEGEAAPAAPAPAVVDDSE